MNKITGVPPVILHATTIAKRLSGEWRGAMILGPSGAGKSDLALRALAAGWSLVADDRSLVWLSEGRLFCRAPSRLAGLIEVRGLGVGPVRTERMAQLRLAAICMSGPSEIERIPPGETHAVLNSTLPCIRLFALEASALAKLTLALQGFGPSL